MKAERTVALADWMWVGHHPMYFKFFTRALLELGCTVVAFCEAPQELLSAVDDLASEMRSRLTIDRIEWIYAPKLCPGRFRHRLSSLLSFRKLANRIRAWESGHHKMVDLVFFASIHEWHYQWFHEAQWFFPNSFSGLYLHSGDFRRALFDAPNAGLPAYAQRLLRLPRLRSIAILDDTIVGPMAERYGRLTVAFPDLTDSALDENSAIAAELKRFASGAPVVGILGYLRYSKGATTLARVALDPANRDLCFAFVGEVEWRSFDPKSRDLISKLRDGCPNAYTHFDRIQSEETFNSCVNACEVIFASYLDFADSSGLITKAAVFRKPIIVSDGFLMAERVKKHQLGEVVPEDNTEAVTRAIRKLTQRDPGDDLPARNWSAYLEEHSYERLKTSFAKILVSI